MAEKNLSPPSFCLPATRLAGRPAGRSRVRVAGAYLRKDFSQPGNFCILDQMSMALTPHCRATSTHARAYTPTAALVRSGRPE